MLVCKGQRRHAAQSLSKRAPVRHGKGSPQKFWHLVSNKGTEAEVYHVHIIVQHKDDVGFRSGLEWGSGHERRGEDPSTGQDLGVERVAGT